MSFIKKLDKGARAKPRQVNSDRRGLRESLENGKRVERIYTEVPQNTQDIIEIYRIYEDGIFEIQRGIFTISYYFYSGGYFLIDDQIAHAKADTELRESLMSDIQITFIKRPLIKDQLSERMRVDEDSYNGIGKAVNAFFSNKHQQTTNGLENIEIITLTSRKKTKEEATADLEEKEKILFDGMKKLKCSVSRIPTNERLQIFRDFYHRKANKPFFRAMYNKKGVNSDFRNELAPISFIQKSRYLRMGENHYVTVLYAAEYGLDINHTLVHKITSQPFEIMMSVTQTEIDQGAITRKLNDIDSNIERRKQKEQANNNKNHHFLQGFSAQLLRDAQMAQELREYHVGSKAYFVSATIAISADSLEELEKHKAQIMSIGAGAGIRFEVHENLQREGLASALPHGVRYTKTMRELVTGSAFAWHPYWSPEVMEHGICYGFNQATGRPIIQNRCNLDNPHAIVLGSSGAAKSGTVKMEIIQVLLKKLGHVVIFDPTQEYKPMVKQFGGAYVDVSMSSSVRINPLEIPFESLQTNADRSEFIADKCELLKRVMRACMDEMDTSGHRSVLDSAITWMYTDFFTRKKNKEKRQPLLKDLMEYVHKIPDLRMEERGIDNEISKELREMHERNAEEVAESFKALTSGSINFFAEESNLDIWDKELVIVGFSKNRNETLNNIAITVFMDYVETVAARNLQKGIDTYFTIDELHELIKSDIIAGHLTSRWKTARHARMILTGILQDITNITESTECRQLLSNSSTVMILNQKPTNLSIICKECNIVESEAIYATNIPQGTGIIMFGASAIPFDLRLPREMQTDDNMLWKILHTDLVAKEVRN